MLIADVCLDPSDGGGQPKSPTDADMLLTDVDCSRLT
jgi:hypothetical protein